MTDIQKAIEYFDGYGSPYDELVIELLEKQVPKQVSEKSKAVFNQFFCSQCVRILFYGDNYCPCCGQKLDWEVDND